jgi:hypothetical protein
MVEQHETSAVHCNERSSPVSSCRAKQSMPTVRGASVRFGERQTSMVVQDVAGPIVTGVLGGD